MSYTEIYGFNKEGNGFFKDEIENSWRGAMAVWRRLEEKYLPPLEKEEHTYGDQKTSRCFLFNDEGLKEIWGLVNNKEVSDDDRVCLVTTFDNVVIKKECLPAVIKAFRNFDGESSLPEQADVLQELYDDPNCIAVGWNQTSVNATTWSTYEHDDVKDESIPYNLSTGEGHWYFDPAKINDMQI